MLNTEIDKISGGWSQIFLIRLGRLVSVTGLFRPTVSHTEDAELLVRDVEWTYVTL